MTQPNGYSAQVAAALVMCKVSLDHTLRVIDAVYQHVDKVNVAGGLTSIRGGAQGHAMLKSLNAQRDRLQTLILEPALTALQAAESVTGAAPPEPRGNPPHQGSSGRCA